MLCEWRPDMVLEHGESGVIYNICGRNEKTNVEVVKIICVMFDELAPDSRYKPHPSLITFVTDRHGHDVRYAIDASKIEKELGWRTRETFESGIEKTINWYLENKKWWQYVQDGIYLHEHPCLPADERIPKAL